MPVLIIGGESPEGVNPPKAMVTPKKFMGIGGKFSDEPEVEDEGEGGTPESSDGTAEARMLISAIESKNPRRVFEAFKSLVQCCSETENNQWHAHT